MSKTVRQIVHQYYQGEGYPRRLVTYAKELLEELEVLAEEDFIPAWDALGSYDDRTPEQEHLYQAVTHLIYMKHGTTKAIRFMN